MPVIKYWLKVLDDLFYEVDTFTPVKDQLEAATLVEVEVLKPLRLNRDKLRLPQIQLSGLEIVNPYKHKHPWKKTYDDKYACKSHYVCQRCGITGWRRLSLFNGESFSVTRSEQYHASKYEYCCDPLTKMPKEIHFYGGH